jgi:hypothetical protein
MKKLVVTTILGLATCVGSFAQGNFTFISAPSAIWDTITTPGTSFKAGATLEVAVMWSAVSNAIPTTYLGGGATATNGTFTASWSGLLTDPNFQLARSTTVGNPVIVSTAGGTGFGAGQYNVGIQYINGTAVGQGIALYVIAWEKSFGTDPLIAAAQGAGMGFSHPIAYILGSSGTPGGSLGNANIGSFGVAPVPEPTTFALLGLSAAGLLIFRRRK